MRASAARLTQPGQRMHDHHGAAREVRSGCAQPTLSVRAAVYIWRTDTEASICLPRAPGSYMPSVTRVKCDAFESFRGAPSLCTVAMFVPAVPALCACPPKPLEVACPGRTLGPSSGGEEVGPSCSMPRTSTVVQGCGTPQQHSRIAGRDGTVTQLRILQAAGSSSPAGITPRSLAVLRDLVKQHKQVVEPQQLGEAVQRARAAGCKLHAYGRVIVVASASGELLLYENIGAAEWL